MSGIFDTTLLYKEKARFAVIAEACLPGLLLLVMSMFYERAGQKTLKHFGKGMAPEMFAMLWFLLVVAWTIALVVAAMNFAQNGLILVAAFSMIALVACVWWSFLYSDEKRRPEAAKVLILADIVLWAAVIAAGACVASEDSKLTVAILLSPIAVWFTLSTVLGVVEKHASDCLDDGSC